MGHPSAFETIPQTLLTGLFEVQVYIQMLQTCKGFSERVYRDTLGCLQEEFSDRTSWHGTDDVQVCATTLLHNYAAIKLSFLVRFNQLINQSSTLPLRQYTQQKPDSVVHQPSQCPKAEIQITVRKRNPSTGNRVCRYLWRKDQLKLMCLQASLQSCC